MRLFILTEANTTQPLGVYLDHRQGIVAMVERTGSIPMLLDVPPEGPINDNNYTLTPMDLTLPLFKMAPPDEIRAMLTSSDPLDRPQSRKESERVLVIGLQRLAAYMEQDPGERLTHTVHGVINLLALIH